MAVVFSRPLVLSQKVRDLMLLLKEFTQAYKENRIVLNYQLRPVILFLSTLIATAGFSVVFSIRSLLIKYQEYSSKKRPALIRQLLTILKNGSREIFVPESSISKKKGTSRRVIIPKPNRDQYAADKYLYKDFIIDQRLKLQKNILNLKFISQIIII